MRWFAGIALLTLGLLQLGFRGMQRVRSDVPLWDFASVYSAARHWLQGGDPYDLAGVVATWRQSGLFSDRDVSYFATVYPPTSLITIAPLAMLPAAAALAIWLAITLGLLALQFAALAQMAQLRWRDPRALLLVGGALAAAPLQFGILSGQLSLPAISLCIIAFRCAGRDRDRLAGALLGLACAIKPQVAGPFVVYYLFRQRPRVSGVALLVGAAIAILALSAMRLSHVRWIDGWTRSIAATTETGGVNDYSAAGEFRDEIVDLKLPLVSVLHDPRILRAVVWCIVLLLAAWYIRAAIHRCRAGPIGRDELLLLSGLCAIALLPVYHRVYDVTLLTTAWAWALSELDDVRRTDAHHRVSAWVLLLPMAIFLIPFDIVRTLGRRLPALAATAKAEWWQALIAPHYAWGLLALTIALLWTLGRAGLRPPAERPEAHRPNRPPPERSSPAGYAA